MASFRFTVPGTPVGKGRPRATARVVTIDGEQRAVISMSTPRETVRHERLVRAEYARAFPGRKPITGPLKITVEGIFAIPPSWPKYIREAARTGQVWHVSVPDADNLAKLVADALNEVAFIDDSQIAVTVAAKRFGAPERTVVTLEPLINPDMPATPAQKRVEARVAAGPGEAAKKRLRANPTKSKPKGAPTALQRAIDAALDREGSTRAAQRGLFGERD